jgi:ParB/RepB/Spo0J family partition protein
MTAADHPPTRHIIDGVSFLHVSELVESTTNPRRTWNKQLQTELEQSIRLHGVLQPLLVRTLPDETHEVVAGARRFRAAMAVGLIEVPCFVRVLTDRQVLEMQVAENLHRADLHPLDEGATYRRLHEEHGYSVEDLAAKVGKSTAYVYGRMQIAKLPVKVQTMLFDGAIELSHALLLARIPVAELQEKAAEEIAEHWSGTMNVREAAVHIERNYQCDLRRAPFPTGDSALLPEAGACGQCPKRTGNQRGLFDEVDGKDKADLCTDRKCFEAKTRAQFARRAVEVEAAGGEVLRGKAAEKVLHSADWVRMQDVCYSDPKQRTWERVLGKNRPSVNLAEGPDGRAVEVVSRRDLDASLRDAGKETLVEPPGGAGRDDERKKQRLHRERMKAWQQSLPHIRDGARRMDTTHVLSLVIRWGLHGQSLERELKARGWTDHVEHLKDQQLEDLQEVVLASMAGQQPSTVWNDKGWTAATLAIAGACGVDLAMAVRDQRAANKPAKDKTKTKITKQRKTKPKVQVAKKGKRARRAPAEAPA